MVKELFFGYDANDQKLPSCSHQAITKKNDFFHYLANMFINHYLAVN